LEGNQLQDQIEELQIKFSFQEGTLLKLNEVVTDQQRDLLLLKSEIRNLKLELQSMKDQLRGSENIPIENEIPPHY